MKCVFKCTSFLLNFRGRPHQPPPMVRHVSDLSWRISAAMGNTVRRSESSVTVDKTRNVVLASTSGQNRSERLNRKMSRGDSQSDDESYSEEVFDNA